MVPRKPNYLLKANFFLGFFDLKKHVFINLRKQIRQKVEGISASQL